MVETGTPSWVQTILILIVVSAICYIYRRSKRKPNLPPGPFSLPFVGTLPFLGADLRKPLERLRHIYGDVYTIYLGSRPTVILNSQEAIKEAFVKYGHSFSGRPQDLFFIKELSLGLGIVSTEGEIWNSQRKFTHATLRQFGMGRSILEENILAEVGYMWKRISETEEQPFNPHPIVQQTVANIICAIVYGSRNHYTDPSFIRMMELFDKITDIIGSNGVLTIFPALKHLPGDIFRYKWLKEISDTIRQENKKKIQEHRESKTPGSTRDIIDAYLLEMDKSTQPQESHFQEAQLLHIITDLFSAGTETVVATLCWALIYMLHYPDIQNRVQNEIRSVIGSQRMPSMKDKCSLPFTEACILETQRMADVVPFGVPHSATQDAVFRGYFIPKGTMILSNLYSVHRDPHVWKDPDTFNPERFMDGEGNLKAKEDILPFSIGKRKCLGESLARMELFLIFTSLLQRFTLVSPAGQPLPPTTGRVGITHAPPTFNIIAHN